jgi:hypothetical protein
MVKKGQNSEEVDEDEEHHTSKQIAKKPRTGNSKATGSGASRKRKVATPVDPNQEIAGDEENGQTAASKGSKKKGGEGSKKGKAAVIQRNEESVATAATGEVDDADDEIIDRGSIQINPEDSTAPTTDAGGQPISGTAVPTQDAAKAQPQQEEDDDEALEDDVVAKPSQTIGREETKALLDTFDEITLSRYEVFRRAHLTKASMKKIVSNLVGPVPASVAIGKCFLVVQFLISKHHLLFISNLLFHA